MSARGTVHIDVISIWKLVHDAIEAPDPLFYFPACPLLEDGVDVDAMLYSVPKVQLIEFLERTGVLEKFEDAGGVDEYFECDDCGVETPTDLRIAKPGETAELCPVCAGKPQSPFGPNGELKDEPCPDCDGTGGISMHPDLAPDTCYACMGSGRKKKTKE
ncbi:MAG: hypothetical protein WC322_06445 [Candidatus Paceibacterota bacterium]